MLSVTILTSTLVINKVQSVPATKKKRSGEQFSSRLEVFICGRENVHTSTSFSSVAYNVLFACIGWQIASCDAAIKCWCGGSLSGGANWTKQQPILAASATHQIKMPSNKSIASSPAVLLPAMAIVALLLMASALAQPPNGGGVHCSCDDTLAVAGGFHCSCHNTIAGDGKLSRAVQG